MSHRPEPTLPSVFTVCCMRTAFQSSGRNTKAWSARCREAFLMANNPLPQGHRIILHQDDKQDLQ